MTNQKTISATRDVAADIWLRDIIEDDLKLWGNFGYLFDSGQQFYAHTNYVSKTVTGGFYFRKPTNRDPAHL